MYRTAARGVRLIKASANGQELIGLEVSILTNGGARRTGIIRGVNETNDVLALLTASDGYLVLALSEIAGVGLTEETWPRSASS